MAGKPGGYSGGKDGPMGGYVGGSMGTGFSDRPDRGPFGGTQVPNYGWEDATLSDFGLLGMAKNLIGGVMRGNVFTGRTPRGFTTSQQRDMGALGPGAVGNSGQGRSLNAQSGGAMPNFSVGRAGIGGYGLQAYKRDLAKAQKKPAAAAAAQPDPTYQEATWAPQSLYAPPQALTMPGLMEYLVNLPAYNYWKRK